MVSEVVTPEGATLRSEATDFVPVDILADYVADARTRWASVTVDEQPVPS